MRKVDTESLEGTRQGSLDHLTFALSFKGMRSVAIGLSIDRIDGVVRPLLGVLPCTEVTIEDGQTHSLVVTGMVGSSFPS